MQEKKSETEIFRELLKEKADDYSALVCGHYWKEGGEKKELFTVWEWERDRKSSSTRHGNIIAICFNRHSAVAVREGLRRMNENPLIQYEAEGRGRDGDEAHSV